MLSDRKNKVVEEFDVRFFTPLRKTVSKNILGVT